MAFVMAVNGCQQLSKLKGNPAKAPEHRLCFGPQSHRRNLHLTTTRVPSGDGSPDHQCPFIQTN